MLASQDIVSQLSNTDEAIGVFLSVLDMQGSLLDKLVESESHEAGDCGVCGCARLYEIAGVETGHQGGYYSSNFDAMSRHSESEGSSDGASEGEAGKRGAGEQLVVSVEGMGNLVSG